MAMTKSKLAKMNKEDIVEYALDLQSKLNEFIPKFQKSLEEVSQKIEEMNNELYSELKISQNVSNLLQERIIKLERSYWQNEQYSRRECLEISGIPDSIGQDELEDTIRYILSEIDVEVPAKRIEACHRIKANKVIIKLLTRKDVDKIVVNRSKLKDCDFKEKFGKETKIFINESLCRYLKGLWNKCRDLKKVGKIHSFQVSNGKIKYKTIQHGRYSFVTHDVDLDGFFYEK